jgi:hypothetical protein
MSNNPLRHVGQTARPEEAKTADDPADDAARQQNPSDAPAAGGAAKKQIPDLKPGEPPPESSAGS